MKILAIDTSGRYLCMGLSDGSDTFEYSVDAGILLSDILTPSIGRVLDAVRLKPADIDLYCAGTGPGSFTSLRIGHAAIKAMAWANAKPVAGISTLDIMADNPLLPDGLIAGIIDAKRSALYSGWHLKAGRSVKRLSADRLIDIDTFVKSAKKYCSSLRKKEIIIIGDGLSVFAKEIRAGLPHAIFLDKEFWYPLPQALISLAMRRAQEGRTLGPFELEPVYLYKQDCQVREVPGR
ncbi:MAG: tRNA (adenosine(37)-N6)-threonylcarbamoyltransferase complex dimerization subunit type 1 TsaB [Candidatus Omnitrophica bacterium]|nr:tRNA (adenosine(37)-N6)-threonylcarbamoyltransferase complex dimerization subunit type 1 TsaB [Candidatus Omnitrophota bacterium]